MFRSSCLTLFTIILLFACHHTPEPGFKPYLGFEPPKDSAILFAPGIVSTGMYERDMTISPDGREIYFTIMGINYSVIVFTRYIGNKWTDPEVAPFSGNPDWLDAEPHISPDGKHLYFLSTRPMEGLEPKQGWEYQDIWVIDKTDDLWGEPYNPGAPLNTEAGEYFPSATKKGTLYFTREENNGTSQAIYSSKISAKGFLEAERLPEEVNIGKMQYNSFIAPDESFIIVCTKLKPEDRLASYGISFRTEEDGWTPLISMGEQVNLPGTYALNMYLTPDEKYLIFGSNKRQEVFGKALNLSYQFISERHRSPQNGNFDLYWIKSDFVYTLRDSIYSVYNFD